MDNLGLYSKKGLVIDNNVPVSDFFKLFTDFYTIVSIARIKQVLV